MEGDIQFNKKTSNNISMRYFFATLMFVVLTLIWPLSLLKIEDPYVNNRLLKQEGEYSYFYVSSGEYLTTVIKGNGIYVDKAAIRLRFQGQVPDDAVLHAYMFDSEGNIVVDQYISIFPRPENDIYEIPFEIDMGTDAEYQFILAPETDFTIGVYCYQKTSEPAVLLQNSSRELSETIIRVSLILKICLWLCGILFIFMMLFGDKLSIVCRSNNTTTCFVPALVSFIGLIVYGQYLFDYNSESVKGLKTGAVLIIALTIMAFLSVFARKYKLLIAGLVIFTVGCIYLTTMPCGMVPDEMNHFYRAFSLSFGNFQAVKFSDVSVGGVLPRAIQYFADPDVVLDFSDTVSFDFKNTSLYSPICYLPQIIGIRVSLLFTSHIHTVFMTARWCGFIGAFLLYMLALYYTPAGKEFMFVVMMLPMTMQEMIGITSDAMTNAIAFLFVAVVLKIVVDNRKISRKEIISLIVLGSCIGVCKLVYVPLLLMLFLIPKELFKNDSSDNKQNNSKKIIDKSGIAYLSVFLIPLIVCAVINIILGQNLVPVGENVDAGLQIKFVLMNIPETIMISIRTLVNGLAQWLCEMTGDFLGGLNIRTLPAVTLILFFTLYISAREMYLPIKLRTNRSMWIYGITFFAGLVIILAMLYVSWTTIGYYIIRGIQGRYYIAFLPVLGLFIASLYSERGNVSSVTDINEKSGDVYSNRHKSIIVEVYILLMLNMIVIVDIYKYLTVNG